MTKRVVSLSVHRNTKDKRQSRAVASRLLADAKRQIRDSKIIGYALVSWDKDNNALNDWDTGKAFPSALMPEFVRANLQRSLGQIDAEHVVRDMFNLPDKS